VMISPIGHRGTVVAVQLPLPQPWAEAPLARAAG
jgi:hypothetical protein